MGGWGASSGREGRGTWVGGVLVVGGRGEGYRMPCLFFVDAMQLFCAPVPHHSIHLRTYFVCVER